MTTLTDITGTKKVNITFNGGQWNAAYVQVYMNEQQVLISKQFATLANATKWGRKTLGLPSAK